MRNRDEARRDARHSTAKAAMDSENRNRAANGQKRMTFDEALRWVNSRADRIDKKRDGNIKD